MKTSRSYRLDDRRRKVLAKLDRGYEDYLEGRISEEFWTRKSQEWEEERRVVEIELARVGKRMEASPSAPKRF